MTGQGRTPGPDHPITVEPSGARVVARVGDRVVADTEAALVLREAAYPPVHYVPLADVDPGVLRPSPTTTHCPYKGTATYRTLAVGEGEELVDAVWAYEEPYPAVAEIAGHVAFQPDKVRVTVES
ncbi:DUF427 domain-containing protein [Nocardiopsis alborubida]|uniref:DUF427 domain-containing protein n=1 Tax=Nocardiopsis alborubida TaxID=146802 RepID=A0A7X6MG18_9ACTN|nr:DUF427 domain-containing protein [Nocardiopsis alborubida]NKY98865.1 DUF427 domain-containing protein [Nocardiopsis alborubida]